MISRFYEWIFPVYKGDMDLVLKNDLSEIARLEEFVEEFAAAHRLPQGMVFQVNLALEELVTNVISYAYRDGGNHQITVRLNLDGGQLRADVVDDGIPFNPVDAPPPDLTIPLEQRPIGGLGIHLVRNLFDTLEYKREDDRNHLTMLKQIPAGIS